MTELRLIVDPPGRGSWNMAVDEALLESASSAGQATLRFYRWSEPTLSLGYFQPLSQRQLHAASRDCPVVRRASGGGAILHDREWTYSLALAAGSARTSQPLWLYEQVHQALLAALAEQGVAARLCPATDPAQPLLCFERRSAGDVLLGEAKICGSAQRRARGAVLQHGSLLWNRSDAAPELPGLEEVAGRSLDADRVGQAWLAGIFAALGMPLREGTLSAEERARAVAIEAGKFAADAWTARR